MATNQYSETQIVFGRFAGLSTQQVCAQPALILSRMATIDAVKGLTKTDQVRLAKLLAPLTVEQRLAVSDVIKKGQDQGFTVREIVPLSGLPMNSPFPLPSEHHIKLTEMQAKHILSILCNPETVLANNRGIRSSALGLLARDKILAGR